MRSFLPIETKNQEFLVNQNIKFTLVQITATGLKKSILDATAPMRTYFKETGIHNYEQQSQGEEGKVMIPAHILSEGTDFQTQASLYRPVTKQGDPRIWIYGMTKYTKAEDIHAMVAYQNQLWVFNLTRIDLTKTYQSEIITPIKEMVQVWSKESGSIAEELLGKFRSFSDQWFESEVTADTGIGRTIETMLDIPMNCSKSPDYKGIELKSIRLKRSAVSSSLFTNMPNWTLSRCKSSQEIVDRYGYMSDGHRTLQVTVQAAKANAQGLQLQVNHLQELLEMQHMAEEHKNADVAVWQLMALHKRLLEKHHETFWIEVQNEMHDGKEYFKYSRIQHTKNPNVGQFDILLDQSKIKLDLMLSRPSGRGDTYSFKIGKKALPLLFPQMQIYNLG